VKAVLGLLSSEFDEEEDVVVVLGPPSDFFIFLARGPELGLSEYLVQKTQAGQS